MNGQSATVKLIYQGARALPVRHHYGTEEVSGVQMNTDINEETGEKKFTGPTGYKQPVTNVYAATNRSDKSYDKRNAELNAIGKPIDDYMMRFSRLQETLRQGSPQADALVAPELLTVMAGGQGSGFRMSEPEIARIVGGRSVWESLKASINKWSLDPSTANSITPAQRQQIRALVATVGDKMQRKQQIINSAREDLTNTEDVNEHRKIIINARQRLAKIDNEGDQMANIPQGARIQRNDAGDIRFSMDGGKTWQTPTSQVTK
jgi:hypothetical protein